MNYGELNPRPEHRVEYAFKGKREHIITSNTPHTTANPNQRLKIQLPKGSASIVIVPQIMKISYLLNINSTDKSAYPVANVGRCIFQSKKLSLGSKEIHERNHTDVFDSHSDLHISESKRKNLLLQGIQSKQGLQCRVGSTKDSDDGTKDLLFTSKEKAIFKTLGSRFETPLDFEFLKHPLCLWGLREKIEMELELNSAEKVLITSDKDATYSIDDINIEYDIIDNEEYAQQICAQYSYISIPYTEITNISYQSLTKKDPNLKLDFKKSAKSLQGILLLFKEKQNNFGYETEKFYNPTIKKVHVFLDGYEAIFRSGGLLAKDTYTEIKKYFKEDGVDWEDFLITKFGLWLDFRSSTNNTLHGGGRRVEGDIKLQIDKIIEKSDDMLTCYIFAVEDAILNIQNGSFESIDR